VLNIVSPAYLIGLDREVSAIPRLAAAAVIRASALFPV
jgi:hypothetical protein